MKVILYFSVRWRLVSNGAGWLAGGRRWEWKEKDWSGGWF